jgi:glycosyltransferase involved in cell wall biosynthesis
VRWVGQVEEPDKEALFQAADMVIVPSHLENFCVVVAEALAHGIPVVASRGTPWPRLESEGCGLWVDNRPESLAQAIDQIERMPLADMGKKGRAWMKSEFSWEQVGRRMLELYERVRNA